MGDMEMDILRRAVAQQIMMPLWPLKIPRSALY
jgi:hypothetical protein